MGGGTINVVTLPLQIDNRLPAKVAHEILNFNSILLTFGLSGNNILAFWYISIVFKNTYRRKLACCKYQDILFVNWTQLILKHALHEKGM